MADTKNATSLSSITTEDATKKMSSLLLRKYPHFQLDDIQEMLIPEITTMAKRGILINNVNTCSVPADSRSSFISGMNVACSLMVDLESSQRNKV